MLRAVFLLDSIWEAKAGARGQDNFHRPCTGNAERQLSVPGSQFSVGFKSNRKSSGYLAALRSFAPQAVITRALK
jgi:hypothetical protein